MVKKSRKNLKRKGGMISKMSSSIAQRAALEYAQRRGPQILKNTIENPENLKDPSVYITGRKSPTENPKKLNIGLIKPIPIRMNTIPLVTQPSKNIGTQMMFKPIFNENDENYNPNIMKAGKTKRHRKISKNTRKRRH